MGEAGRVASRESVARRPPPHPVFGVAAVVVVAAAVGRAPGPQFRWALTLYHTRPTHSGNGKEWPTSAQAPGERARSLALPPSRLGPNDLLLRRRRKQTMKRGCAEGLTRRLFQLPTAQACLKDQLEQ